MTEMSTEFFFFHLTHSYIFDPSVPAPSTSLCRSKQGTQKHSNYARTLEQHAFLFCKLIKGAIINIKQHLARIEANSMKDTALRQMQTEPRAEAIQKPSDKIS